MDEKNKQQSNSEAKSTTAEETIAIVDEITIRDRIYEVRGLKVMLDVDLAHIYGYETKAFNQQVKRNIEKFDDDFRFQLTEEEADNLRSQNVTSSWGGTRYLPWAFTEQGIYMLMTVLKGDLATLQSKALIRTFKAMKDHILSSRPLISQNDLLRLSLQMTDTNKRIQVLETQVTENAEQMNNVLVRLDDTIRKSELPAVILEFDKTEENRQLLLLNGEPARADETYIDIFSHAKQSIYLVDNYVSIKTLRLLQKVRAGVNVVVFSDNSGNYLHSSDLTDFQTEYPQIGISFKTTGGIMHDRFIVLDFGTQDEKMYHCGASAKDAGKKLTSITEFTEDAVKHAFGNVIRQLQNNSALSLR